MDRPHDLILNMALKVAVFPRDTDLFFIRYKLDDFYCLHTSDPVFKSEIVTRCLKAIQDEGPISNSCQGDVVFHRLVGGIRAIIEDVEMRIGPCLDGQQVIDCVEQLLIYINDCALEMNDLE